MIIAALAPGDLFLRLGAATLAGSILGINRDLRGKPAGLRTHALVTLGAALIVIVSSELARDVGQSDVDAVSRVIQGLITGIGFLGAGVIIHAQGEVRGLTSAATVWVAAMLGVAYGGGHWMSATAGLALTLITLVFGGTVEGWAHRTFGTDRREGDHQAQGQGGRRLED